MQKSQNKSVEKAPEISERKKFLINLYNNYKAELKKVNQYLTSLNHNLKIVKILLKEEK